MEETIFGDNSSQSLIDEKTQAEMKRRLMTLCILIFDHYDSQKKDFKVRNEDLNGIIVMDFHVKLKLIIEDSGLPMRMTVTRIDPHLLSLTTSPRLKKR